ncbi:restriction endonuclease subunit S [Pseudoalteromonas sp. S554]|uniref:restriction endonuclease subunit S n=1 Tax=Pseudoalteromonas sp. S554 TaxID=2066516 RepID=UPI00110C8EAA|nr:restriction endonuclease subunit S [Pseudoalteromonas sp. S554]TMS79903.1 restriction endonuclease subunit S [Pseudoalteromonas sp. S554]
MSESEFWKEKKLDELIQEKTIGLVKGSSLQSDCFEFDYVKMHNISSDNSWNPKSMVRVNATDEEVEKFSLQNNDFLFNTRNSYELVGKSCLYQSTSKIPVLFNNNIMRIKFSTELNPKFAAYAFCSKDVSDQLTSMKQGTTGVSGIYYKTLKNLRVKYPPIPEQKRIVAILDQAFHDIEQARAKTEQNLKNARELFESYLQQVFSQRGEGWEDSTLNIVAENLDSKRVPITKKDRIEGEYPYYGASGIVDYVDDYLFDEELLLVSEDGANLLARTYPIAFSASGRYWVNNHAHVLKFKDRNTQKFIEYYLNSISLAPYVSGMAQPKLNQRALNSIPVPKVTELIAGDVVSKLEVLENEINQVFKLYKSKLDSLDELKKSILQKAFSGELTKEKEGAVA